MGDKKRVLVILADNRRNTKFQEYRQHPY